MANAIITIGMPIKNRIFCIDRVLTSVSSQTYPKNKIKLVFIDESTDGTYEKLLRWKKQREEGYLGIQVLRVNSKGYISTLRNLCVSNMEGDIIFFWDSDVLAPDNDALSRVIQKLVSSDDVAVVGFHYERESPCLYEKILRTGTELGGLGFTAIKRSAFDKVGLFNEKLRVNEDTEFFCRVKLKGFKIVFDSSTPCLHLRPETQPRYGIKRGVLEYLNRLKFYFSYGSLVCSECIKQGSKLDLLRTLYYLALPPFFLFWVFNFLKPIFSVAFTSIFFAAYLSLSLFYHIWKTRGNRLFGIVAFAYYIPCGIAVSYGYIARLIKSFRGANEGIV
jgi:glycosyltransferase involved in cell wall biosynthesis